MARAENPLEVAVEKFADKLVSTVEGMPEEDKPFGSVELTAEEQIDQYLAMREDPQAFVEIIEEQGMRAAVDYVVAMEAKITKLTREA